MGRKMFFLSYTANLSGVEVFLWHLYCVTGKARLAQLRFSRKFIVKILLYVHENRFD